MCTVILITEKQRLGLRYSRLAPIYEKERFQAFLEALCSLSLRETKYIIEKQMTIASKIKGTFTEASGRGMIYQAFISCHRNLSPDDTRMRLLPRPFRICLKP